MPSVTSLVDAGAIFEPEISSTISNSPVTIICVPDYQPIYQILDHVDSLRFKTIINLTNGTPRDAMEMKEWMYAHGVTHYYDGGIMATPEMIATPASFIFCSEDDQRFTAVTSIIEALGKVQYVGTDPGAAALRDLALLAGMYGMFAGAMTAMAMLKKQSIGKIELQVTNMLNPWLQAIIPYHAEMAKLVDNSNFVSLGNPVGMQSVAMQNILKACDEEEVDAGRLRYFGILMERVVTEHGGEGGIAQVLTFLLK